MSGSAGVCVRFIVQEAVGLDRYWFVGGHGDVSLRLARFGDGLEDVLEECSASSKLRQRPNTGCVLIMIHHTKGLFAM